MYIGSSSYIYDGHGKKEYLYYKWQLRVCYMTFEVNDPIQKEKGGKKLYDY